MTSWAYLNEQILKNVRTQFDVEEEKNCLIAVRDYLRSVRRVLGLARVHAGATDEHTFYDASNKQYRSDFFEERGMRNKQEVIDHYGLKIGEILLHANLTKKNELTSNIYGGGSNG